MNSRTANIASVLVIVVALCCGLAGVAVAIIYSTKSTAPAHPAAAQPASVQAHTQLNPTQPAPTVPPTSPPTAPKPTIAPPTPKPTSITGILPGLLPADVTVNLEQRRFKCGHAEQLKNYFVWTCNRKEVDTEVSVLVYGRTLVTVDYIDSAILQSISPNDEIASSILGFIATMPFDGSEPQKAQAWVKATLPTIKQSGDVREAKFGGVDYRLFGWPPARNLQIGNVLDPSQTIQPTSAPLAVTTLAKPAAELPTMAAMPNATTPPSVTPRPTSPSGGDTCCKHCGTTSKPCGDTCISLSYTCSKPPGCACP